MNTEHMTFYFISKIVYMFYWQLILLWGFPGGLDGKESACSVGDPGSIPGLGRSPGEVNGNPLWYPCLKNSMAWRAWQAIVHGITESQTWLSNLTRTRILLCIMELNISWFPVKNNITSQIPSSLSMWRTIDV